ncbi:hypothetical protein J3Q64DRAFT_1841321 [Phycomyces blakesleeanus]|uniref:Uncharacterized protein n=2 Tax=Phycomyces blakesleeanus TaxID=4837 RepID=A0A162UZ30_PHYB8|nr:hypothetical protein PHYBLDRAFT_140970 [Phycomyces blakesleeanus NRRL 1555(-)]OAD78913.1 hypothetical protein PHYBLDRAFT_140970 [Phycomyces blakesleeanus NRRL 1555(-)]|eukprot:XP_018296953.1 hypothetical protein PHYBLDRAFT_140970 [Phycomyces blakesleeanus NRRL 1555(-)]
MVQKNKYVIAHEVVETNNDDKHLHELGKVVRESKDVLDGLLNIGKLKLPTSTATMSDFLDTFSSILLFVSKLEKCAIDIKCAIEQLENRRSSIGFTFNRARPLIEGRARPEWMRPTWYSPPASNKPSRNCLSICLEEKHTAANPRTMSNK